MLAIRLQRTGRKGHAQYRVIVQDAHRSPKSGKIVAQVGHYNPHAKTTVIDKEKVTFYLQNGAQPSDRIVKMLVTEGIALPDWVRVGSTKARTTRNPEKLRRNRPAETAEQAEKALDSSAETVTNEAEIKVAENTNETSKITDEVTTKDDQSTETTKVDDEESSTQVTEEQVNTEIPTEDQQNDKKA